MENRWWHHPVACIFWTVARLWLGVQWLMAGIPKAFGGFNATGYIQGAIAKASGENPVVQEWYGTFLENVVLPNIKVFNFIIPWGEVLVGIGLILGALTIPALIAGGLMNFSFLFAGTISTNPNFLFVTFILLLAGRGSYYFGVDRFLFPYLKNRWKKRHDKDKIHRIAS